MYSTQELNVDEFCWHKGIGNWIASRPRNLVESYGRIRIFLPLDDSCERIMKASVKVRVTWLTQGHVYFAISGATTGISVGTPPQPHPQSQEKI